MKGIKGTGNRTKADYQRAYRLGRKLKEERDALAQKAAASAARADQVKRDIVGDVNRIIAGTLPGVGPISDTLLSRLDETLQEIETSLRRVRFQIAVYMEARRVT